MLSAFPTTHTQSDMYVEQWTKAQWALFDAGLYHDDTNTILTNALHKAARGTVGSGMGSYTVPEQLDRVCCAWLRAAATRRSLGTMVHKLHRLDKEAVTALEQYEPLLRPTVWRTIDDLLHYPHLAAKSHPGTSASYDAGRRMLVLRSYVMAASGAQNPVCVNCGKHSTPYPRSWIEYDDRATFVWCRACYHPKTITARELGTRWGIDPSVLDGLDSIAAASRRGPTTNEYLWAQVMHGYTDRQLACKTYKRKADDASCDGDGDGGDGAPAPDDEHNKAPTLTARKPIAVLRVGLPNSPALTAPPPPKRVADEPPPDAAAARDFGSGMPI